MATSNRSKSVPSKSKLRAKTVASNSPPPPLRAKRVESVSIVDHSQTFWSANQVRAYLGIGKTLFHRLRNEDPAFPVGIAFGNSYRFRRASVVAWAERQESQAIEERERQREEVSS